MSGETPVVEIQVDGETVAAHPGELLIDGPYEATQDHSSQELTALFLLCAEWLKNHSRASVVATPTASEQTL